MLILKERYSKLQCQKKWDKREIFYKKKIVKQISNQINSNQIKSNKSSQTNQEIYTFVSPKNFADCTSVTGQNVQDMKTNERKYMYNLLHAWRASEQQAFHFRCSLP